MKVCSKCGEQYENVKWICPKCNNHINLVDGVVVHDFEHSNTELGFPQEAFHEFFELEQKHFWFRSRTKLIIWLIRRYFPEAVNFLEIGCGTGFLLECLSKEYPDMHLTGSDISLVGLSYALQNVNKAIFTQFDIINLPYIEEYDLIGAFDVLEHIEDDLLALKKVNQALVCGGGLIISVPQHPFLWSEVDIINKHKRRYMLNEVKLLLRESGFEMIRTTSFVSFLLPIMLIKRLLIKTRKKQDYLFTELKINAIVNKIFEIVMSFERQLIKAGVNFLYGGSLIVVARKK